MATATFDASRRNLLAAGPMAWLQWLVVGAMFLLNVTDGFDVLAMSFAGAGMSREFSLAPAVLGVLFSAGFVGMAIGSLVIAPFADRIGRKPVALGCLTLMVVGMTLSANGHSFALLLSSRVITGLGAGALSPVINALVAEYASDRRRGLAISISQLGFAVGGLAGGMLSAALVEHANWRSIFAFGATFSALCFALVLVAVPESPDYLIKKQPRGALTKLNKLVSRLGRQPFPKMPLSPERSEANQFRAIVAPSFLRTTICLSLAYLLALAGYYMLINWLPKLLVMEGIKAAVAVASITIMTGGSIVGGISFGLLLNAIGYRKLTIAYSMIGASSAALMAFDLHLRLLVECCSFGFGLAIGGALTGLFAMLAAYYPVELRATAAGVAVGAGRGGSMAGPLIAGIALQVGLPASTILLFTAALLLAAAGALLNLHLAPRDHGVPEPV